MELDVTSFMLLELGGICFSCSGLPTELPCDETKPFTAMLSCKIKHGRVIVPLSGTRSRLQQ